MNSKKMMSENRKRHIVIYSIHYYPELIGIGVFNHEMAQYLAKKDLDVTVVTAFPWYPYWKVMDGYKGRLLMTEELGGINVKRSYVYSPQKVNSKTRIIHETIFAVSSLLNIFPLLFKKVDAVFTVCPPLQIGLIARLFCMLKRIPLIFHVQDLQVDAAFDMGMLKSRFLLNVLTKVEKYLFKKATMLTTISSGMRGKIIGKGIDEKDVSMMPNWIDTDYIKPMPRNNKFRAEYGISEGKFLALYAGNIGEKQGVDIVIDVAEMTQDKKEIFYVIAGEGANRAKLQAKIEEKRLNNMMLMPLQSREMLPYMLAAADISLIIQKKAIGDIVMPSKILNIMASARPVVATANQTCELSHFINKANCGIVVEPENPVLLKDAILKIYSDPAIGLKYGANGRTYAIEKLSAESVLGGFVLELQRLLSPNAA
ncbi:MAG: WcaI family glycosyltransferase [Deltaproteobacteria bacterium]|nr:WcaI family glycosyltransferase [Deltaproteobacteria bacterium]